MITPSPVISSVDHEDRASNAASLGRSRLGKGLCYLAGLSLSICAGSTALGAETGSATLAWDSSPQPDLAGYILYYGTSSRIYPNAINIGNVTSYTVSGLLPGVTYFFAVTDYNGSGTESPFSDEITYQVPLNPPAKILSITPVLSGGMWIEWESGSGSIYRVAFKNNLTEANWTDLSDDIVATAMPTSWTDTNAFQFPSRFYRVRSL